ncbi:MAG TPA: PH domain-containing protein, partial [Thermoanaerobaculia bacterium]|nr:PH domain-containing protein [Thermoanaerobaculia bacterium]
PPTPLLDYPLSVSSLDSQIFAIHRPSPALFKYYVLSSFLLGPLFFFPLIYLYFRYHTMRYEFDEEGISMRWGILFRREITLTYARIQDIHLTSNILERWLKLARIQIQTASASAAAEMTIEGLHEFETVRDFLYTKMRGVRATTSHQQTATPQNDLAAALREVASELRAVREALEKR